MRLLDELAAEPAIAWDFDGTLVDSPAAPILHAFIRRTPHITHVIVTFRTLGLLDRLWSDLAASSPVAPPRTAFAAVYGIPHEAWHANEAAQARRGRLIIPGEDSEAERFYRHFKARTCVQIGSKVLIDDDTPNCAPGCTEYGVRLLHPNDFLAPS